MQHNSLFEILFKKEAIDAGNSSFLEQLVKEHPYFSPAQFYLLQQSEGTATYQKQAAKTAVFFDTPYWLNFQLAQTKKTNVEIELQPVKELKPVSLPQEDVGDDAIVMEKEIAPIKIILKLPEEGKTAKADELLFEPMHLVDYFASQGIKLSEDVHTGDKLGKQLKSFTEWLKTMKKVHTTDAANTIAAEDGTAQTDTNIQSMAEKSNTEGEVLTESMADVLVKQGKSGKAMEIYQKLSLLDPAKSAYFAAKIEQLKGI